MCLSPVRRLNAFPSFMDHVHVIMLVPSTFLSARLLFSTYKSAVQTEEVFPSSNRFLANNTLCKQPWLLGVIIVNTPEVRVL